MGSLTAPVAVGTLAALLLVGAVVFARISPAGFVVIQHICSDPFILGATSPQARLVRQMLTPQR